MKLESPFLDLALDQELDPGPSGRDWAPGVARLLRDSPFGQGPLAAGPAGQVQAGERQEGEAFDDEDRDALAVSVPAGTDAEDEGAYLCAACPDGRRCSCDRTAFEWQAPAQAEDEASLLEQDPRAWILSLDHSALERLPDPATRKRYLEEIDWRGIEFPGNPPTKAADVTPELKRQWALADALFSAMARVVPERRVPSSLKFHIPKVEEVPGQANHSLVPEARDTFVRMRDAAAGDGVRLVISSSWRSAAKQADLSKRQKNPNAVAKGKSAHMYGLAVDLRMSVPGLKVAEANTRTGEKMANLVLMYRSPVYKWLALHGQKFGWYPYRREPWHWEYNPPGFKARFEGLPSGAAATGTPATAAPAAAGAASAEQVRFAQRVLNAAEGERLGDDGDLGPLTRAALERFRARHGLGAGGVLDAQTELALAQRALEELAQASLFAQMGVRDATTEQALAGFKAARGLGLGSALDAATRRALAEALVRKPAAGGAARATSAAGHLGGQVWTFQAKALPLRVAVFCPPAARAQREVEVLLFAHGLLSGCPKPRQVPEGFITDAPFRLGQVVHQSGRAMVLVVPLLDWANPGGKAAFGAGREKWHALARPDHLNAVVAEVLAELARVQGGAAPALRNLVIAGHSRAYDFLEPLARHSANPQMRQGALATLSQVWALDTTYAGSVDHWSAWLKRDARLQVAFFYRPGTRTAAIGDTFWQQRGGRLAVTRAAEGHCDVPGVRLPGLLQAPTAGNHETEAGGAEDEDAGCSDCEMEDETGAGMGAEMDARDEGEDEGHEQPAGEWHDEWEGEADLSQGYGLELALPEEAGAIDEPTASHRP